MYTSRLPISTSVRRPTGHTEGGSTSFVGLQRPSNIPVTVRKPNLFTPQTKRPFSSSTSTAGKSQISGMTTDKKFQRSLKPMPDKEQTSKMFDTLVEFLRVHAPHLPLPDAKKFFSSVSTTESSRIFEFLIGRMLPEFKITRLETDVPEMLAFLEYPYIRSVTKSSLVSVTTRQAAIGLLHIFHWLIGVVNQCETDPLLSDNFDELDVPSQIYRNVLINPETAPELNRQLFDRHFPKVDLNAKLDELDRLDEEIEASKRYLEEVDELVEEDLALQEDIAKARKYNQRMEEYIDIKQKELDDIERGITQLEFEKEAQKRRLEKLTHEIEHHEFSVDQVKQLEIQCEEIECEIAKIESQINEDTLESELLEREHSAFLQTFRQAKDERLRDLKKMLFDYETHSDIKSEQIPKRAKALRDWVIRLEQIPDDDLGENQKALDDLCHFYQELKATDWILESELKDSMLELKNELEALKSENEKHDREIARKGESIESVKREMRNDERLHQENMSKVKAEIDLEVLKTKALKEKHEKLMHELEQEKLLELKKLEDAERDEKEFEELATKHFKIISDRILLESDNMIQEAKMDAARLREAAKISEENLKVSTVVAKLVDKLRA